MPRSRKRKGAKPKRRYIDGNKVAGYYDPGHQPKAPTTRTLEKRGAHFLLHRNKGGG